ncbi:type II toxin-antitoxin system RelE/ParE family toxin [Mesorhizobium sp. B2-1-3A]|uniref:type II toxin-antitoxin system RelE/ParE family toxin n=1 Tax=Mesorhizobium sp. B2-1-3A TaxID=2589971 RepID=UPI001FEEF699|nr:type II toxin-antitoxin system RelE/ParE family toxin [Mesorhizobium sp. B2-1-3A]
MVDTLERRWDLLTLHPFSGAPRDDIAPGIRHLVVGDHLTLYRVRGEDDRNRPRATRASRPTTSVSDRSVSR